MTKGIGEFILAGLAAPGLGLFASWFGLDRLSKHNDVPVAEMADYCARLDPALVGAGCESVELLTLLQQLSIAALAATIAVPLLYWLCALVLGRKLVVEQAMLAAPQRLGVVHGDIGGTHQRFDGRAMVRTQCDAHRSSDIDAVSVKLERLGDGSCDAPGNAFDIFR